MVADALESRVALGPENPAREIYIDCQRQDTLEEHAVSGTQGRQAKDLGAVQTEFHGRRTLEAHVREHRAVAAHLDLDSAPPQGEGERLGDRTAALHYAPCEHPGQGCTEAEGEIVSVQHGAAAGGTPQQGKVDPGVEGDERSLMKTKGHCRLGPVVYPQHSGTAA